ncbi:Lipoamide acyltransferase component of branched-chain alpha-keto acid dehydrogenase complex, mitochondrial [Psilocybe cubensis]|uniref:Lipoamide acyltransferase component of branched-chain alpha-keto acid dehydrogenase complex, mitochondrial n=1 Tax=Psilocybe cubensis TaxID=181762 RepID=A0ACB8HI26_PSICU|nr:Lipoamide acyltransferase component of branched-chain alpha-keto acid dehydrogenase complex, mitochondrial [Psilocybe cubensis]KAH9487392.1 Lipoamide acyltransferase component of branched-chain alpha-keto acid dehydrogenase complex, mitochondrial [Psilocybe cubensis]
MFVRPVRRLLGRPHAISYFHSTSNWWASRKVVKKFNLADIGEGITECEVVKWSVKPQATVQSFDALCEVQSDKASVEITSPFDGVVKELLVQEGEIAKVGSGLCLIEIDEEEPTSGASTQSTKVESSSPSSLEETAKPVETLPPPLPLSDAPSTPTRRLHPLDPNNTPQKISSNHDQVFAAPSVRYFARQNGVDLSLLVPGSGKGGRIEKKDVEAAIAGQRDAPEERTPQPQRQQGDVVVELGRTRYGMWKAMVKSLEIPHFGYSTTLDITALHEMLPTLNAHIPPHYLPEKSRPVVSQAISPSALYPAPSHGPIPDSQQYSRLTYLPILVKTLSKAMVEWPVFRSSITTTTDSSKPTLTIRPNADISVALSTPTGLYSPTLQSVNTHSIYSIAAQLKHLSHLGRQTPCALTPKEMPKRGGTITISNVGAIGAGDFASPVLVPGGGVAIVAIGRAKWVWDVDRGDGTGERRLKLGVSWSGDHRVVEGAELAAFVECWRGYVEVPQRLIAEGI